MCAESPRTICKQRRVRNPRISVNPDLNRIELLRGSFFLFFFVLISGPIAKTKGSERSTFIFLAWVPKIMKVFAEQRGKTSAFLDVLPEDQDDIYALYQVIMPGAKVKAQSSRSISVGQSQKKERVSLLLEICVEIVSVDLEASLLFMKGTILNQNKYTRTGAYHTLEISPSQRLTIAMEKLDPEVSHMFSKLAQREKAETAYIIARKNTYAFLLSSSFFLKRIKSVPREKSKEPSKKAVQEILREIKEGVRLLISIGDTPAFANALKGEKGKTGLKCPVLHISQVVAAEDTTKGDRAVVVSACSTEEVKRKIENMKYNKEIVAAAEYLEMEKKNTLRTVSGVPRTLEAAENYLLKKVVVIDSLLKSADPEERAAVSRILGLSREARAESFILSQFSPLGEQILIRGGIAAVINQEWE